MKEYKFWMQESMESDLYEITINEDSIKAAATLAVNYAKENGLKININYKVNGKLKQLSKKVA